MNTIALACNLEALKSLDEEGLKVCKDYPGAGWTPHFVGMARRAGYHIDLARNLLPLIEAGANFGKIYVIQEQDNSLGSALISLGALPLAHFCLESEIYAASYYENPPKGFAYQINFSGGNRYAYFPSYDEEEIIWDSQKNWNERSLICTVMSHKHYAGMPWAKKTQGQLHDYRYEAMRKLQKELGLEVWGRGWDAQDSRAVKDKRALFTQYKYCLVIENDDRPGYHTEKLVDCLVSGCIPIYHGNGTQWEVFGGPRFIHGDLWLCGMPENLGKAIVEIQERENSAWDPSEWFELRNEWLQGPGKRFQNRNFAKTLMDCLTEYCSSGTTNEPKSSSA